MKIISYPFLLISIVLISFTSYSQISFGGEPLSYSTEIEEVEEVLIEAPDPDIIDKISARNNKNSEALQFAVGIAVDFSTENSGLWQNIGSKRVWRLKIRVPEAKALGAYFDDFWIPEGGKLFIYNESKKQLIGSFTHENNSENGLFATELIQGELICFEYVQGIEIKEGARISISEISYAFDYVSFLFGKSVKDFGDSDPCEVNVNCSPEGNNWQDEKRGVLRIATKVGFNYYWCTASVVNNVRQDFEPYVLTADHCGGSASSSDMNMWIFYFNFESSSCNNPSSSPTYNSMTGCSKKAAGGNSGASGSDFLLVLLNNDIPQSYNPYFNGWNNSATLSGGGVSIHHPSGDIKKISTYTQTPITSGWNGSGYASHWRVYWVATTNGHGVTEGGSSGSPLFDNSGRVIGTLTGGASYCVTPNLPDYYGKFSYSWNQNGNTASTRLKDWLDPDNTGATYIDGINMEAMISGSEMVYCSDAQPDTLTGIPSGGTFSGTGMTSNIFNPATAGVGTHYIYYFVNGLTAWVEIEVVAPPGFSLGADTTLITGQSLILDPGNWSSYLWNNGSQQQTLTVTQSGTYSVTISDTSACEASDDINVIFTSAVVGPPGWNFTNTGSNHSVLVLSNTPITIDGTQIENGDFIGVFYDSSGVLACAGFLQWTGQNDVVTVWGDDSNTQDKDGMDANEEFKWKIYDQSDQIEYSANATYLSAYANSGNYSVNGISGLASLEAELTEVQSISMNSGWSIFSTYIIPDFAAIDSVMTNIVASVVLVKNQTGDVYWPAYGINNIGNMVLGQGYQSKFNTGAILDVSGQAAIPELTPLVINSGWSIIGYLRQSAGDVTQMLSGITNSINLVKNDLGDVYWPQYGVNNIGQMYPGEGYQVNMNSSAVLTYPAN